MIIRPLLTLFLIMSVVVVSCSKTWKDPNTSIPYQDVPITTILISPHAYDSAGVNVEGMVWDLNYHVLEIEEVEVPYTTFKIANADGNFINVYAEGNYSLNEGEQVKVIGVYRREFIAGQHTYINEIVAKEIKHERTSNLYRLYKFLR